MSAHSESILVVFCLLGVDCPLFGVDRPLFCEGKVNLDVR